MQDSIPDGEQIGVLQDKLLLSSIKKDKANHATKVLESVRQAIVTGNLRPNQRIVESQIAKRLGMSRTPVREALKTLEMQGYLSKLPNGGLVVTDYSPSQIRNLCETREALETMAMKLACQRATKAQLDKAAEYHDRSIKIIHNRDINAFIKLNRAFHNELLSACGNEQLRSLMKIFQDQFFDRRLVRVFNARDWRTMIKHHQDLLDALRQGNVRRAEKVTREHVRIGLRIALERL